MEGGGQRLTLWDQMSAVDGGVRDALTGLTLGDVLSTTEKRAAPAPLARVQPEPAPQPQPQPQNGNRTLLDVIQEQDPNARSSYKGLIDASQNNRDKKSWKTFKDKLCLKRGGASWTSSIRIPASDIPIQNGSNISSNRVSSQLSFSGNNGVHYQQPAESVPLEEDLTSCDPIGDRSSSSSSTVQSGRLQISRRSSSRFGPSALIHPESTHNGDSDPNGTPPPSQVPSLRPQFSRHNSTRYLGTQRQNSVHERSFLDFIVSDGGEGENEGDDDETSLREPTRRLSTVLAEERALSAREAVAAQEAAEAAAAAEREQPEAETEEPGARMSLMDLMDYNIADEEEEEEEEEKEKEEEAEEEELVDGGKGVEHNCCVCMVRHKGAAFIPCGHTFCRLCSRELMVSRGNCPLCNRFILEILDIF